MMRRLPVVLRPHPDELLSSWIKRHSEFYAVPALGLLRHCLPEASSLRTADIELSADQEVRLGRMFSTDPAVIRRMTFGNIIRSAHRFIATKPAQYCTNCINGGAEPAPILRSQLLGWRITCPQCGSQLEDTAERALPSPFQQYRVAALRGEKLLDDEAERGARTWASSLEIARLLLMRRIKMPSPLEEDFWRFRILGAIIPDLDDVIAREHEKLPSSARPVLSIRMRPALLAGVAIVESAGSEMLRMLRGQMMGENRVRFTAAAERMIAQSHRMRAASQMQLI